MDQTWIYLNTGKGTPTFNMALDEMLLTWHSRGEIPPAIRFYQWDPATLSIGYFQKIKDKIDLDAVREKGLGFVRRLTGGRAVLHDQELTYSVVVAEQGQDMPRSVIEAYRVLSQGILEGYKEIGIEAEFSIPQEKLNQTGSAVCFEEPSWYELVIGGRKAAGSAQTRQKGVILQHGSIPIEFDDEKLFDLFIYPNDKIKERSRRAFKEKAVAIQEVVDHPISIEDVEKAFKKGFEKGLHINLEPYTLSSKQLEEVRDLEEKKFGNDEWTYYR
ncbi:biotin/lipoate A/B protein ligase family protein [Bacillaceae bacterium S4-13-58]